MIDGLDQCFPPDAVELLLADPVPARNEIAQRRGDVLDLFAARRAQIIKAHGARIAECWDRSEAALGLSLCRLALRHGRFGDDFHPYHNESHALEIFERRLGRVIDRIGIGSRPGHDWIALGLFASCHDLRQRELLESGHLVGSNEAASIAESHRILDRCGFDRGSDQALYLALEVMIAGSTFDARPVPQDRSRYNTAEVIHRGGPLAPLLAEQIDAIDPRWREQPGLARALELALIASDLDTANVGESFVQLCDSAARLAAEREMRSGRALDRAESGAPVLAFLTSGQERYFFELHRFCSEIGAQVYGPGKAANAGKVRAISQALTERFGGDRSGAFSGRQVLDAQQVLAQELDR
ncbi:MAG: hypothetical protein AB7V26_04845 [Lysobacterales bacterium]